MLNMTLYNLLLAQETVQVGFRLNGLLALLAGILILIIPRLLNYIVAIYLILVGLIEVFGLRLWTEVKFRLKQTLKHTNIF